MAGWRYGEPRMRRLLTRTSITEDEAVGNLLGLISGPIEFEPIDGAEDAGDLMYCLREDLEDKRDVLEGEYDLAKREKQSQQIIAEKLAVLQSQEAIISQANVYLCAIRDELNKGEGSVLKVDRALSNTAYTFITLHSFNEWGKSRGGATSAGEQPGAVAPSESNKAPVQGATKQPRDRHRKQEDAILEALRQQGFDPLALPKHSFRKAGAKAAVLRSLKKSPLFKGSTTFKHAWDRLRGDGRIAEGPDPTPHKKSMGETSGGG